MGSILLVFGRSATHPLLQTWDDNRFIASNPDVQQLSLLAFVNMWTKVQFEAWHPLHLMSYWLDVPWSGASGSVIHSVNIALWCGASVLLWKLLRMWGLTALWATVATLLVAIHPVQVEAVTWATGRKEILALGFCALSGIFHAKAWSDSTHLTRYQWLARLFFLFALLSKTTAIPWSFVLFAADVMLLGHPAKTSAKSLALHGVLSLVFSVLVLVIWNDHDMIRTSGEPLSLVGSVLLISGTLLHDISTIVRPVELSPVYPIHAATEFQTFCLAAPLALAAVGFVSFRKRAWLPLFVVVAFVLLLLPTLNIVPVYFQFQDRYLSLALVPVAFGFAQLCQRLAKTQRATILCLALSAAAIGGLGFVTYNYQDAWKSDESLWLYATRTHPDAYYAWMMFGEERRAKREYGQMSAAYRRAMEAAPRVRLAAAGYFNSQILLDEEDRSGATEAPALTQRYMRSADDPIKLRELAGDMIAKGYTDSATFPLSRALALAPLPNEQLEHAASVQLRMRREFLVRFYLAQMDRDPALPELRAFLGLPAKPR